MLICTYTKGNRAMRKLIFFSIMCFVLLRCSNETGDTGTRQIYKEYLIDSYVSVDRISISPVKGATFAINCSGPIYSITSDDASNVAIFKELAAEKNDNFKQNAVVDACYSPGDYQCFAENFKEISIHSNIAWDDRHSAGDSLNDLCYFMAYSYAPALKGELSLGALSWIKKRANELTNADLELLEVGSLRLGFFDKDLPIMNPQTITVLLTTENEKVLTASYKITGK